MAFAPLSASFQSLPLLPTVKSGPSGAASWVDGFVYVLGPWVSPTNSPVRLGVSPAAASTPTGVFNQWFEALFPPHWSPELHSLWPGPPATALPWVLSAQMPISTPPTGLDECVFFNSLVVRLPYSSIFCQFWLFFVFKLLSYFWLFEEAQCVYLHLHLCWKFPKTFKKYKFHHQAKLHVIAVSRKYSDKYTALYIQTYSTWYCF